MKLEIELDLNKIDYDAINKQIAEKVAELNIKEEYDIQSKIDNKIKSIINDEVNDNYNDYIDRYWHGATSEGKKLIESMSKAEIENRINKILDDIFSTEYNEDALREIMLKIIPDIFACIMFKRMESSLFNQQYDYMNTMHNIVRSEIDQKINNMRSY